MNNLEVHVLASERRQQLLAHLSERGAVGVPDLSERLDVSPATVRRDLQILEEEGQVKRVRGGAIATSTEMDAPEPPYDEKIRRLIREKRAIARTAAGRVRDGDVVALDSGSTTFYLARELMHLNSLTVITTDVKVGLLLADAPQIDVAVTGGSVRLGLYSLIGPLAEAALSNLNAQHVFLGADAINTSHGVTNACLAEIAIKRALLKCGRNRFLIADHSKFDRVSLATVAALDEFDEVITDDGLANEAADRYGGLDMSLTLANTEE